MICSDRSCRSVPLRGAPAWTARRCGRTCDGVGSAGEPRAPNMWVLTSSQTVLSLPAFVTDRGEFGRRRWANGRRTDYRGWQGRAQPPHPARSPCVPESQTGSPSPAIPTTPSPLPPTPRRTRYGPSSSSVSIRSDWSQSTFRSISCYSLFPR